MCKKGDLEGELLILKPLQYEYIDAYLQAFSPLVQKLLAIPNVDSEREYLLHQLEKVEQNTTFFVCIFEKASHRLIGALEIRSRGYRSQLYNWVNENFWGTGYYQQAMQLAIPQYFNQFPEEDNFNARVDISNQRSYWALKKLGFIETGIFKGAREEQYNLVYFI